MAISVVAVTPIVVRAVGVPANKQPSQLSGPPASIRNIWLRQTLENQYIVLSTAVDILHIVIDAVVHIQIRVWTLCNPLSTGKIVLVRRVRVDTEQWTGRAAPCLIRAGSSNVQSRAWLLDLIACCHADGIREACVALAATGRLLCGVLTWGVLWCDTARLDSSTLKARGPGKEAIKWLGRRRY